MSVMNKEELSELILQNQKEMYVLAYSILQNQSDAQDAVSECIVRAFENRTSLRKRASARSWLIKILINVSRSAITKRQKVVLFADPSFCHTRYNIPLENLSLSPLSSHSKKTEKQTDPPEYAQYLKYTYQNHNFHANPYMPDTPCGQFFSIHSVICSSKIPLFFYFFYSAFFTLIICSYNS